MEMSLSRRRFLAGTAAAASIASPEVSALPRPRIRIEGSAAGSPTSLSVIARRLCAPPGRESRGDQYIVAAGAAEEWSGCDGDVATWTGSEWVFRTPFDGALAWVKGEARQVVFRQGAWQDAIHVLTRVGVTERNILEFRSFTDSETVEVSGVVAEDIVGFLREDGQRTLTLPARTLLFGEPIGPEGVQYGLTIDGATSFSIRGAGRDVSVLKVADGAGSMGPLCLINQCQRFTLMDFTCDGNADSQGSDGTGYHGLRMAGGATDWVIARVGVRDTIGYGFGIQNSNDPGQGYIRGKLIDIVAERTGDDGVDLKNTFGENEDILIVRPFVFRHQLRDTGGTGAGLDIRAPYTMIAPKVFFQSADSPSGNHSAINVNNTKAAMGVAEIYSPRVRGDVTFGIRVQLPLAKIVGGHLEGCARGYQIDQGADDASLTSCLAEDCTSQGFNFNALRPRGRGLLAKGCAVGYRFETGHDGGRIVDSDSLSSTIVGWRMESDGGTAKLVHCASNDDADAASNGGNPWILHECDGFA
jgi:hypothetical protein